MKTMIFQASTNSHHIILNLPVSYPPVIFCLPIENHKCEFDSFFCSTYCICKQTYISCSNK